MIGPGGDWHKACLTCVECKKTLNSGSVAEHKGEARSPCSDETCAAPSVASPDAARATFSKRLEEIVDAAQAYCKPCHDKSWGPKGYGFAQGGATTMRTS